MKRELRIRRKLGTPVANSRTQHAGSLVTCAVAALRRGIFLSTLTGETVRKNYGISSVMDRV